MEICHNIRNMCKKNSWKFIYDIYLHAEKEWRQLIFVYCCEFNRIDLCKKLVGMPDICLFDTCEPIVNYLCNKDYKLNEAPDLIYYCSLVALKRRNYHLLEWLYMKNNTLFKKWIALLFIISLPFDCNITAWLWDIDKSQCTKLICKKINIDHKFIDFSHLIYYWYKENTTLIKWSIYITSPISLKIIYSLINEFDREKFLRLTILNVPIGNIYNKYISQDFIVDNLKWYVEQEILKKTDFYFIYSLINYSCILKSYEKTVIGFLHEIGFIGDETIVKIWTNAIYRKADKINESDLVVLKLMGIDVMLETERQKKISQALLDKSPDIIPYSHLLTKTEILRLIKNINYDFLSKIIRHLLIKYKIKKVLFIVNNIDIDLKEFIYNFYKHNLIFLSKDGINIKSFDILLELIGELAYNLYYECFFMLVEKSNYNILIRLFEFFQKEIKETPKILQHIFKVNIIDLQAALEDCPFILDSLAKLNKFFNVYSADIVMVSWITRWLYSRIKNPYLIKYLHYYEFPWNVYFLNDNNYRYVYNILPYKDRYYFTFKINDNRHSIYKEAINPIHKIYDNVFLVRSNKFKRELKNIL